MIRVSKQKADDIILCVWLTRQDMSALLKKIHKADVMDNVTVLDAKKYIVEVLNMTLNLNESS